MDEGAQVNVWAWFGDPAHWTGPRGIPHRLLEHVELSALSVAVAAAVALPLGVLLGHRRRGEAVAAAVVNIGRAVPSFGILAIAFPIALRLGLGLGFWPTFLALVLLGIPPMFTNTYAGVSGVGADVVEAARACGMRERAVLLRVELPLAAPLVVAGVRVAAVQIVATATLGAVVAWGGLGRYIVDGLAVFDSAQVFGGAVLVAGLSLFTELLFAGAGRVLLPAGIRRTRSRPL